VGVARNIAVLATAALAAGCGGGTQRAATSAHPPPARTVTDTSVAPVARPPVPRGPHDAPVPILMYHVIASPPPGTPYPQLWVDPARFGREIDALAHAGYHATTLDAVWRAWHGHGPMPRHPIVLSFDDGYQSQSTTARRMLDKLRWPGVLNLAVKNVGLKGGLSRNEVRAMIGDGWEIDAHTISHVDLTTLDAGRLRHEVAGSRAWLRRAFGAPVDFFCYPAGRYNATVEAAVRRAGYNGATTTNLGEASLHDDPYALPRIRVTPQMSAATLVSLVRHVSSA
jgi:peptidoglycan/xylan/chitin deacetylase (PgdA/CDA1 family)